MDGTIPTPPPIQPTGGQMDQAELEAKVATLEADNTALKEENAALKAGDAAEEAAETPSPTGGPEHTRLDDLLVTAEADVTNAEQALKAAETNKVKIQDEIAALPAGA